MWKGCICGCKCGVKCIVSEGLNSVESLMIFNDRDGGDMVSEGLNSVESRHIRGRILRKYRFQKD